MFANEICGRRAGVMGVSRVTRAYAIGGIGATIFLPGAAYAQAGAQMELAGVHIRTLRAVGGISPRSYEVALQLDSMLSGSVRIGQLGDVLTPADLSFITSDPKIIFSDPKNGATIGIINIPLKIISLRMEASSRTIDPSERALTFVKVGNFGEAIHATRVLNVNRSTISVVKAQRDIDLGLPQLAVNRLINVTNLDDSGKRILADAFILSGEPVKASLTYASLSKPATAQPWLSNIAAAKYKAVVDQLGVTHADVQYDDTQRIKKSVSDKVQSTGLIPPASLYIIRAIFGSIPRQFEDDLFRFTSCYRELKTFEPSGAIGRLSVRFSYLFRDSTYVLEFAMAQRDAGTTLWIPAVNKDVIDHGASVADSIADAFQNAFA